ncbi:MAG: trehalose-phosphatase [Candidatus Omnitrophica bacterium]|nr:trehalose-phosphatase [Candidatus Omnitrophota bacterium]
MMRSIVRAWPHLKPRIQSAKKRLLLLDFDGTLVPIAKTPDAVVLSRKIKKILDKLQCMDDTILCIISGRSVRDLKNHFGRRKLIYIGNHGFEFHGSGMSVPDEARRAKKLGVLIWLMARNLKEGFHGIPGILVEDKTYTLSVHYRNLPQKFLPIFREKLKAMQKKYAHLPLTWKTGKKVWAVHPKIEWDKGAAALYICCHFPKALPIVIGDDVTDEDMFKALRRNAITIRVGRSRKSLARYYLKSPKSVAGFLEKLGNL